MHMEYTRIEQLSKITYMFRVFFLEHVCAKTFWVGEMSPYSLLIADHSSFLESPIYPIVHAKNINISGNWSREVLLSINSQLNKLERINLLILGNDISTRQNIYDSSLAKWATSSTRIIILGNDISTHQSIYNSSLAQLATSSTIVHEITSIEIHMYFKQTHNVCLNSTSDLTQYRKLQ